MTPQAGRAPALPVFLDSSCPPLPRSSVPAWTTMVRCSEISIFIILALGRSRKAYANNALGSNQLDQLVRDASLSVALAIGLEVTQVTDVALVIFGGTVGLVEGVDCHALAWIHSIIPSSSNQIRLEACRGWVAVKTHSGVQHSCNRWCCLQRRGRAYHAPH